MATTDHPLTYGVELAIQGIQGAVTDLRGLLHPPVHPHVQATQAIYWICSFDENHRGIAGYKKQRDGSASGAVMNGLRFARNAVTHGVVPLAKVSGETFKIPGFETSMTIGQWTWRTRQEVVTDWPKMDPRLNSEPMLSSYDNFVASRQIAEPIITAYGWINEWSKIRYGVDLS